MKLPDKFVATVREAILFRLRLLATLKRCSPAPNYSEAADYTYVYAEDTGMLDVNGKPIGEVGVRAYNGGDGLTLASWDLNGNDFPFEGNQVNEAFEAAVAEVGDVAP